MPLPRKIDTPESDTDKHSSASGPFSGFTGAGIAAFSAVEDAVLSAVRTALGRPDKPEPPRVGEYYADYSELTPEEIAADDPDCTDLFENSKPSSR